MRWILLSALLLVALPATVDADGAIDGEGPWVLRATGWTDAIVQRLADRFDHFAVFSEKGLLLIQADDRDDLAFLRASGMRLEVDDERTATLRLIEYHLARGVESFNAIPGFECYRTVPETLAAGAALADAHPTLATWIDIGDSWEKINAAPAGFDIRVLRLTNSAVAGDKPALLVTGSIHPREYATAELVARFAELLLAGHGVDPDATWILDHHEVHLVLIANPDGRIRADTGLSWRKNADNDFCTDTDDRGIDLNRNFDFEWGCCNGSSGSECSTTFRGPSAASEPETQALQAYMTSIFPDQRPDDQTTPAGLDAEGIYLDVHSFGQVVLSSWGFTFTDPPNAQGILTLGRKYGYFPGYTAQLGSTGIVDGSTKDFAYGRLGVPAYTVELGTAFFQQCSVFDASILAGNLAGLLHAAKNVRTPYVTPSGPDTVDLAVPPVPVAAGQPVTVTATVDDTRYQGAEPSQNILSAEVYVDTPPWQAGTPIALAAEDGVFDQTVEDVTAALDTGSVETGGLAPGRHTLFVRGEDAAGNDGAVSGAFVIVIDPVSAPTLEGTVTGFDGAPLHALMTIGPFQIETDPGTGAYTLQLPSGSYDVTAAAPGFGAATANVDLADFETEELDFRLLPLVVLLDDDVESGNLGWTAEAPWAITDEAADSPTRSWADSPGANYADGIDTSLTSPVFDLSGLAQARITFSHLHDFETGFDTGSVEVSTDGFSWTPMRSYSQALQNLEWTREEIPLPMLDGEPTAQIRFRVNSDANLNRDGWHVDDIRVSAAAAAIFVDGFESGDTSAW
ncbi:MAG: hypothetical protein GY719_14945 [bacterium]|nr:hypothetical protein [bacterium]